MDISSLEEKQSSNKGKSDYFIAQSKATGL